MRIDPNRQPFSVLIGGGDWAAELTQAEFELLRQALGVLLQQLQASAPLLMPEEDIELDVEQGPLWMRLSGSCESWSLRFVLADSRAQAGHQRGLEGGWDCAASAALATAIEGLL